MKIMDKSNNVKALRKKRGMSIRELSTLSTIPISTLGAIESAVIHPQLIQIYKIAQALRTDAGSLGCTPKEDVHEWGEL
jgi:transcriptional regulator with XRE-family HTH domain